MKVGERVKLSVIGGVCLPLLLVMGVQAQTSETTDTAETTRKTLQERLNERKAARSTRLTTAQQTRLRARCKAAQTLLGTYHERVKTIEKNRINAYDKIVDHLTVLITKVGDQVETAALQTAVDGLEDRVEALQTNLAAFRQTVADVAEMDCVSDPTAFRASLDTLKEERAALLEEAVQIRSYIQETVKPALREVRSDLQAAQGEVIN